ncbi:ABC transporter permease [Devosia aurantiaca]|uniref:ABC transporter permease n=1 Tax=Devosia aurantiaca TaxID=2714858 RepID=A0A6M1SII5_9HYPH|nr:ABC transporter permease [Devosia aurantiaca]NGP19277.1 ABC transporter permease [Devosia aurantiaca]
MTSPHRNDWRWVERAFHRDLMVLITQRRLAWQLYLADVAEQRRSSGLGLFAPFISVLVHVALLGSVMALVFNEPVDTFIPFFAVSFSLWQAVSTFVSVSSHANDKVERYLYFPTVSGYIVHLVNCYEFLVALILKISASFLVILIVSPDVLVGANYPGFFLGVTLLCLLVLSWSLPFAYYFDRFRLLRGFLPQLLFAIYLMTPILWDPSRLDSHIWIVNFNPLYHVIEAARSPLLHGGWPLVSYFVVVALAALGLALSAMLYPKNRDLVIYRWVA